MKWLLPAGCYKFQATSHTLVRQCDASASWPIGMTNRASLSKVYSLLNRERWKLYNNLQQKDKPTESTMMASFALWSEKCPDIETFCYTVY